MIVTIKVDNYSDMTVAALEAEMLGIDFTKVDTTTFDVVVMESWKLDFFLSKIGHAEVMGMSDAL